MSYPDEYLNHHADRYVAGRLHAHGVSLDAYLADPARYDVPALALEPEFLLPAQQAVADRLAAQWAAQEDHDRLLAMLDADLPAAVRLAGGGLREPLHHHQLPRSQGARRRFYRGAA
jgi:hypothetical protein